MFYDMTHRHLCSNFVYEMTLLYYIYPSIMPEVNVSATVEMSATVGEMSATVGEMSATVGKLNMV